MRIRPRFCRLPERTPDPTNPSGRSSDPPTKSRGTALRTVQIRRPTEQKLAGEQIQQNEVAEELRTHLNQLPVPMDLRSTTWTTSSGISTASPGDGFARMWDTAPGVTDVAASMPPLVCGLISRKEGRFRADRWASSVRRRKCVGAAQADARAYNVDLGEKWREIAHWYRLIVLTGVKNQYLK